jgi:outer membrane lipoprotein SlyB
MMLKRLRFRHVRLAAVAATAAALSACVVAPPPPRFAPPPPPPPNVTVYAYPQQGQTAEQQDRDHYECSNWATQQTGFNPSAPNMPPHDRVQVVSGTPPGAGAAVGAVTGGILGAAVSGPGDAGAGLLLGALVGGVLGAGAQASATEQAQAQADASVNARIRAQAAQIERSAADYRRALGACLEGRGYSVH